VAGCAHQVSAVIIAFNEEADIARALESVAWCNEVLVVDSGSSDRTIEICVAHGCKVLHREFDGYGEQKAFAVTQAANDWILSVDADEEVSPALRDEILFKLERTGDCHGYYLPVTTVLWDHVVRTGRRHTKPKLRLFDRRFGNFGNQLVHESVSLQGLTEHLCEPIFNYSFVDFADYFDKFNRYTSLAALECFERGNRTSFLGTILRLPLTFFKLCFIRGFILDGSVGLIWSLFASLYTTVKHLKLLELCRAEARRQLAQDSTSSGRREGQPKVRRPRAPFLVRRLDWRAALRKGLRARGMDYGFAACSVVLVWILMGQFGRNELAHYSMFTLASVVVTARFWGFGPALAATALGLLGLDYFVIPPVNAFILPSLEGLNQLALFAAVSLLSSFLIYVSGRNSLR
jgi:glycosyltransferase involved in cell wall biosynthesis